MEDKIKELKPIRYIDYKIYNVTKIKNKYGFRIVLILDDNTQRTIQRAGFEKKELAEKEKCKIIGQLENKSYVVYTNITVETYFKYWFKFIAPKRIKSYNSYMSYRNGVYNHIIKKIGNLKLVALTSEIIEKLYSEVFIYSENVAKLVKTIMISALSDAKRDCFIPTNEALNVKIPKKESEKIKEATREKEDINYHTLVIDDRKIFTIKQLVTIIREGKNTPIYLHILFAILMGLRKSEINGIKYSDIDFVQRKLKLTNQLRKKNRR